MWGNITKHVGAALQKVQKLQNELESQLDAAVGADDPSKAIFDSNPIKLSVVPVSQVEADDTAASDIVCSIVDRDHQSKVQSNQTKPKKVLEGDQSTAVDHDVDSNKDDRESKVLINIEPSNPSDAHASDITQKFSDEKKDVELSMVADSDNKKPQKSEEGWDFDDIVFESRELKTSVVKKSNTDLDTVQDVTGKGVGAESCPSSSIDAAANVTAVTSVKSKSKVSSAIKAKKTKAKPARVEAAFPEQPSAPAEASKIIALEASLPSASSPPTEAHFKSPIVVSPPSDNAMEGELTSDTSNSDKESPSFTAPPSDNVMEGELTSDTTNSDKESPSFTAPPSDNVMEGELTSDTTNSDKESPSFTAPPSDNAMEGELTSDTTNSDKESPSFTAPPSDNAMEGELTSDTTNSDKESPSFTAPPSNNVMEGELTSDTTNSDKESPSFTAPPSDNVMEGELTSDTSNSDKESPSFTAPPSDNVMEGELTSDTSNSDKESPSFTAPPSDNAMEGELTSDTSNSDKESPSFTALPSDNVMEGELTSDTTNSDKESPSFTAPPSDNVMEGELTSDTSNSDKESPSFTAPPSDNVMEGELTSDITNTVILRDAKLSVPALDEADIVDRSAGMVQVTLSESAHPASFFDDEADVDLQAAHDVSAASDSAITYRAIMDSAVSQNLEIADVGMMEEIAHVSYNIAATKGEQCPEYQQKLVEMEERHATAMNDQASQSNTSRVEYEQKLVEIEERHATAMNDQASQSNTSRAEYEQKLVEIEERHATAMNDQASQSNTLRAEYEQKLVEMEERHATAMNDQASQSNTSRVEYEQKLVEIEERHATAMNDQASQSNTSRAEYEQKLVEIEERHATAMNDQASQSNTSRVEYEQKLVEIEERHARALLDQAATFELQISSLSREASDSDAAVRADEDLKAKMNKIAEIEEQVMDAKRELRRAVSDAADKDAAIGKLTLESSKLSEIVGERERALETAAVKMAETHKQLELSQRKIADLVAEVAEKDSKLRQSQVSATSEAEVRKQLSRAQEIMKEKEERLAAFELEGQNLSKKQSEMEKVVRTTKGEVKKRDAEIVKLKESKEQLVKAIEEMQDLVRKNESEASNATKNLSAMQAVSHASTDKLSRLEADIASKTDELSSQRRAMESAWAENNELKRVVVELRADRDDLRRQIGLGTSKVMETESSRRDIEQREAVLRATNKQLQDSLQRQMQESALREERLRDEVGEMRKRWQEAITSRETLSSELGSATAPLMRQISSMQDSMRSKSETWQAVETSLSERALRAESVAEIAVHKKSMFEEQVGELKLQTALLSSRLEESITASQTAQSALEKLQKTEACSAERIVELESRLALEAGIKQSLQSSLRELELRHKIDQQEARDTADLISQQGEGQLSRIMAESEALRGQLEAERGKSGKKYRTSRMSVTQNVSQDRLSTASSSGRISALDLNGNASSEVGDDVEEPNGFHAGENYTNNIIEDTVLPNGDTSFAATERMQQQRQRKDEGTKSLHSQIQILQASRDALLDEVNYLSAKNAKLEEDASNVPSLLEESRTSRSRIEVLLVLLGEKEEEVEAMLGDIKDIKDMYKDQMEELLEELVSHRGGAKTTDESIIEQQQSQ